MLSLSWVYHMSLLPNPPGRSDEKYKVLPSASKLGCESQFFELTTFPLSARTCSFSLRAFCGVVHPRDHHFLVMSEQGDPDNFRRT